MEDMYKEEIAWLEEDIKELRSSVARWSSRCKTMPLFARSCREGAVKLLILKVERLEVLKKYHG